MLKQTVLAFSAAMVLTVPVQAEPEEYIMDTSDIGRSHNGVVRSDQFLELGMQSSSALRIEGENSLRLGDLDRALTVLQRSVELAPLDIDGRIIYAQALEQKLIRQKHRDPGLFNFVVKQWLFVAKKSEFPDQALTGRNHLIHLTGTAPKLFEKEPKYLARVLMPEDGSEQVALGKRRDGAKGEDEGGTHKTGSLETFLR